MTSVLNPSKIITIINEKKNNSNDFDTVGTDSLDSKNKKQISDFKQNHTL